MDAPLCERSRRKGRGLVSPLVFKTSCGQITLSVVGSIPTLSATMVLNPFKFHFALYLDQSLVEVEPILDHPQCYPYPKSDEPLGHW